MSVVIFGQRAYGRVFAHGGERADTLFFHIQFLPLFPTRSQWVTSEDGADQKTGFETRLNARSILAAYLRVWAPIGAVAAFASLVPAIGAPIGLILLALSAWSWTWIGRIGQQAQRRSDMDRIAFGHRCVPAMMPDAERERLQLLLSSRLARRTDPRPPDDVARFGARDFDEAIAAYGLLRLSQHRDAHAAADQLMSHAFDAMPSDGGPFRSVAATASPDHAAVAEAIRAEIAAEQARRKLFLARRPRRWYHRPGLQLVGLGLMTIGAISGTHETVGPAPLMTDRQLDEILVPTERVKVTCDAPPTPFLDGKSNVSMCQIGKRQLPIVSTSSEPLTTTKLDGHLHRLSRDDMSAAPSGSYAFMLRLEPSSKYWENALATLFCDALLLTGWVFWIRAFRRRRAAKRASR